MRTWGWFLNQQILDCSCSKMKHPVLKKNCSIFTRFFCISTWGKCGTQNEGQADTPAFRNSATVKIEIIVYLNDSNLFTFQTEHLERWGKNEKIT